MKVLGQLESASLENLAGNPANAPTGRIYSDITSPTNAVPKFYTGTSWKSLAFNLDSQFISQNSGKAITVDWSLGLRQQVVLTDNCLISFSNPQEGQTHYLIVKQNGVGGTGKLSYVHKFNMTDQDVGSMFVSYQPSVLTYNTDKMYAWVYKAAALAAYTTVPGTWTNASPVLANTTVGAAFSADGKWLAYGVTSSPFFGTYGVVDCPTNYVTPFTNPSGSAVATAAATLDLKYSPDGRYVFTTSGTSPFIQGWWTNTNGNNNLVLANPGTLPAGAGKGIDVHPTSGWVTIGHTTTPFMSTYPLINGAYGNRITPASLPVSQAIAIAWSPFGDFLAAACDNTPFIQVWPFTINSSTLVGSFGAIVANPSTLPIASPISSTKSIAWRPQGDWIVMSQGNTSPYVYLVPFNRSTSTFGAPVTFPALSGGSGCVSVDWTPDGQYLIVQGSATPYCYVYDFSLGTITTPVTLDVAAPASAPAGQAMHPSGWFAAWTTQGLNKMYLLNLPNKQRNYVRLV